MGPASIYIAYSLARGYMFTQQARQRTGKAQFIRYDSCKKLNMHVRLVDDTLHSGRVFFLLLSSLCLHCLSFSPEICIA